TDRNWQTFKEIDLIPDENGNVELLDIFWDSESYQGLPPLLIYADLMSSGSDRNVETAKMILENELQYIK
ncbi:MAG: type IV toxin-antitoxin system AbiEi family antitoxin, partial [Bacteroidota bacterium]